jgi:site-specific DNA-methyltransferase (adenine-specific)
MNSFLDDLEPQKSKFSFKDYFNIDNEPYFVSSLGALFHDDCLNILPGIKTGIKTGIIDTIFADPPFNLKKVYRENTNDNVTDKEYISWSKLWLKDCVRILKLGGSLFVYNLPKWNIIYGSFLMELGLTFRHWIAIDLSSSLPIVGRLYPSHYSLLYFSKGKPNAFKKIRTPIEKCRHCGGEIKDYGGHRKALNPNGISLKDIWTDISPVRHWKFKDKSRSANALSTKLVSRAILMSANSGDIVLDPFGGSGTTYDCCENLQRLWLGVEIDYVEEIVSRLTNRKIRWHNSLDYIEEK